MTTERQRRLKTYRRPLSPEELELHGEGAEEQADEALEWAEFCEDASWEALQLVDPD